MNEFCRKMIEVCAPGGIFILAGGAQVDGGNPENLRAMIEADRSMAVINNLPDGNHPVGLRYILRLEAPVRLP